MLVKDFGRAVLSREILTTLMMVCAQCKGQSQLILSSGLSNGSYARLSFSARNDDGYNYPVKKILAQIRYNMGKLSLIGSFLPMPGLWLWYLNIWVKRFHDRLLLFKQRPTRTAPLVKPAYINPGWISTLTNYSRRFFWSTIDALDTTGTILSNKPMFLLKLNPV